MYYLQTDIQNNIHMHACISASICSIVMLLPLYVWKARKYPLKITIGVLYLVFESANCSPCHLTHASRLLSRNTRMLDRSAERCRMECPALKSPGSRNVERTCQQRSKRALAQKPSSSNVSCVLFLQATPTVTLVTSGSAIPFDG